MVKAIENLRKKKLSGGKRHAYRGRRASETDNYAIETTVGEVVKAYRRQRGGHIAVGLRAANFANVYDPSTKKVVKSKIIRVKANPANRDYERRGVITKGATIETELGLAQVTSRPSTDGAVSAVLQE
ncbi:MAG: 30S ribosomal protein S8e [Thaumarchaeota archaeon]|nr:30S ribosomal protein S8e [Nitrososphaerota archaeon]